MLRYYMVFRKDKTMHIFNTYVHINTIKDFEYIQLNKQQFEYLKSVGVPVGPCVE